MRGKCRGKTNRRSGDGEAEVEGISEKEVTTALKEVKEGKAIGPDNIPAKV